MPMSKIQIAVLFIIGVRMSVCTGAEDEKLVHTYGVGMTSCGTLIQSFRDDSPNRALNYDGKSFPTQAHTYQEWLAGFVTAYNMYTSESGNLGSGIDISGLTEWIHSYCEKNPTNSVIQAASSMVVSLERK